MMAEAQSSKPATTTEQASQGKQPNEASQSKQEADELVAQIKGLVKELLESGETVYDGPEGTVFLQDVNKELRVSGKPVINAAQLHMLYQELGGEQKPAADSEEDADSTGDAAGEDAKPKRQRKAKAEVHVDLPTVLYHADKERKKATTRADYDALRKDGYKDLAEFPFEQRKTIHTRESAAASTRR